VASEGSRQSAGKAEVYLPEKDVFTIRSLLSACREQASPAPPQPSAGLLELLGRPVEGLSLDEIAATCQGLAEQVRCAGMQSLEALGPCQEVPGEDYPLLRRSLQLLVDSGDLHAQSARWGAKHRRIWFPVRWQCWPENRLFARRQ